MLVSYRIETICCCHWLVRRYHLQLCSATILKTIISHEIRFNALLLVTIVMKERHTQILLTDTECSTVKTEVE